MVENINENVCVIDFSVLCFVVFGCFGLFRFSYNGSERICMYLFYFSGLVMDSMG